MAAFQWAAVLSFIVMLAGCRGPGRAGERVEQDRPQAVVVCRKCETIWPHYKGPHARRLTPWKSPSNMKCPDCETAVVTFFKTGRFQHSCKTCGGQLLHCKPQ